MSAETESIEIRLPNSVAGKRLDQALSELVEDFSRARLQRLIRDGSVLVDRAQVKPNHKVFGGESIVLIPDLDEPQEWLPEPIDLTVVFEDADILVINKPAGLVVHPAAGNWTGTLVNGVLHRDPAQARLPRAGIVHRLDKDTTGLMVVARSERAHRSLVEQLSSHTVARTYQALVFGDPDEVGSVNAPIGRHPKDRKRMAVVRDGKRAVSHFRVVDRFGLFARVRVELETGRTHQIRVHMAHLGYPLIGDEVYGRGLKPAESKQLDETLLATLRAFPRQALHAGKLRFLHPADGHAVEFSAPLPDDMAELLALLQDELALAGSAAEYAGHNAGQDAAAEYVWGDYDDSDDDPFDDEVPE